MALRLDYKELSPEFTQQLMGFGKISAKSSLGRTTFDLVNIRVAQLNRCAFCLDMHIKEAKIHGERELRIHHLPAWRESPLFSQKERAALEWTEAVTQPPPEGISHALFKKIRQELSEKELSDLTFMIGVINFWTRLNISFCPEPGSADAFLGLDKAGLT